VTSFSPQGTILREYGGCISVEIYLLYSMKMVLGKLKPVLKLSACSLKNPLRGGKCLEMYLSYFLNMAL